MTGNIPKEFATATIGGSTYLYVANLGSNSISEFKRLMVDKSNRFLLVADSNNGTLGSGDIYSFTINPDSSLTSVGTYAYNAGNPV